MSPPLRILQVTRVFRPHVGGIERHVEGLSRALLARGHEVEVLTLDRGLHDGRPYPRAEHLDGLPVRRVPFVGSGRYPLAPGVLRHVRGFELLHVHALDFLVDLLALTRRWHRRPIVLSTHGGFFHTPFARRLKEAWFRHLTPRMLGAVDALVCTSDEDLARFAPLTDRAVLVRNAVDLAPWQAREPAPVPGRLLVLGRVDRHKGLDDLLRALAVVRDRDPRPFEARLVGPVVDPRLEEELRALADRLGLGARVVRVGPLEPEALHAEVAAADLAIHPSTFESFGLAVVETMAAGVPVVVNDIPAFRHLVRHGVDGLITDFRDPGTGAAAILAARDLGARRNAVVRAARERAGGFGWDEAVPVLEAVYRDVLARRPGGGLGG